MPVTTIALSDKVDTTKIVHERIFAAVAETIALKNDGIDPFTSLMLHMDGADGSTTFTDQSPLALGNANVVGTAQVDTDLPDPWGGNDGYLLLNGTTDYVWLDPNVAFNFDTGNFVVEAPFISTDTVSNQAIYGQHGGGFSEVGVVLNVVANRLHMYIGGNAGAYSIDYTAPTGDVCDGNWNHCTVLRSGNLFYLMLNGVQVGVPQFYAGSVTPIVSTAKICIGALRHVSPAFFLNGGVAEVRVSKGTDRGWSGGFTPPPAPYFEYAPDSPSPATVWTPYPVGTVLSPSTFFRTPENLNTGDAGAVKYFIASNGGADSAFLTQAQVQALGDITITDTVQSIKMGCQLISDGTQKTTCRAFAEMDATFAAGGSQAAVEDVRRGTVYNDGALTGTAYIPVAADTREGTPVDATVGTLAVAGPNNVRKNIPTDDTVGNYVPADPTLYAQNQQYGANGTEFTGSKTVTQFETPVEIILEDPEIIIFEGCD